MTQDEKHAVALMRYGTIAPLVSGTNDAFQSLDSYYREAAAKSYPAPDGSQKHFSAASIERWYRAYLKDGFDALMPKSRSDSGKSRCLDDACQEFIRHMKTAYPRMPSSMIYRSLLDHGLIQKTSVSESSVSRFVNQLMAENRMSNNKDMRRYERPHINEVWCGDSSVGPRMITESGKKKVYIIALIDDASRFITGIDIFFQDNFVNLMSVMKSAVSKYGRPKVFNFDNGSAYKNKQMELLCARIGSTLNYCQPYTPTAKAKVERWFRTMKDQWMSSLDMRTFHSLDELRTSLYAFVNAYNQTPHSSLSGRSPVDRFFSEPDCIRRLGEAEIERAFLLEIERTVSADSVVVINHTEYEVDYRFAKRRIRLRYSPDLKELFVVEQDGSLTSVKLLHKHDNSMAKRNKTYLCRGDES